MLPGRLDESKDSTAERSKSASLAQPNQSRNESYPMIYSGTSASGVQKKSKKSSRELDRLKFEFNPLSSTLDDYVKLVQKRVISRKRSSSNSDYHKRFMRHTRYYRPPDRSSSRHTSQPYLTSLTRNGSRSKSRRHPAYQRSASNYRAPSLDNNDMMLDTDISQRGQARSELPQRGKLRALKQHLGRQK